MLRLTVNGSQIATDDEGLIAQQVNRRRADGVPVCVQVRVEEGSLNMVLSSPQCGQAGGGSRPPNPREKRVFDLWEKFGLSSESFAGGQVVAFVKQLRELLP